MTSLPAPRVVLGLQGAQMPANAIRGIGRWVDLFVRSLVSHRPEMLAAVSIDGRLPIPRVVNVLPDELPILFSAEKPHVGEGQRLVFHAMSVMEDLPLERIWPNWAQDPAVGLVVTVYDMIPALFPGDYFQGSLKYLLESRYELLGQADAVMAISRTTRADILDRLPLDPKSVFVVPVEPGRAFRPHPAGRAFAHMMLPDSLRIAPDFILTIGNVDPRKNLEGLMRAYACLPPEVRGRHQLVLTSSQAGNPHLEALRSQVAQLGLSDRVVVLPYVEEATMVQLYQACHTMVFPSFYEGLGLPVIEAMRCGACTLVSGVSALREVVHDPEGWFDPGDLTDIGDKLLRVLTDDEFADRRRTQAFADAKRFTWDRAARPVQESYCRAARARP